MEWIAYISTHACGLADNLANTLCSESSNDKCSLFGLRHDTQLVYDPMHQYV